MLKTTISTRSATNLEQTESKVGDNSIVGNSVISSNKITIPKRPIKSKNQAKTIKSQILIVSKNRDFFLNSKNMEAGSGFFTLKARLTFIKLRQVFIEAPILHQFDSKC